MGEEDILEIFYDQSSWKGELRELSFRHTKWAASDCFPQIVYVGCNKISTVHVKLEHCLRVIYREKALNAYVT